MLQIVFFLFDVLDLETALACVNAPESAEFGRTSSVLDGEYHIVTPREV